MQAQILMVLFLWTKARVRQVPIILLGEWVHIMKDRIPLGGLSFPCQIFG